MRNVYGTRDNCIFLEFNSVVGTDAIFYPMGNWGNDRVEDAIVDKALAIIKHRPNLELVGYTRKNDSYGSATRTFPKWVYSAVNGI